MKVASITGSDQGGITDVRKPQAVQNWALIKVYSAPMCTEYKGFMGGNLSSSLGHEAAGEVVEVAQPSRVKVGDRVVVMPQYPCGTCSLCVDGDYIHCENSFEFEAFTGGLEGRATMAQYLLKPDWLLPAIPDGVSYDHGAMACCGVGPTFGAMDRMGVSAFDTVLITGLGPVGLGGVLNGVYRGARVIGCESHPWRAQRALELGATDIVDPSDRPLEQIAELTSGKGVDKVIDCSGNPQAHRLGIDAVRRRGQVAFVGQCSQDTIIRISPDMIRKGITLVGSWHYNLQAFPKLMQLIERSGAQLDRLISHRFPLDQVADAWALQKTGECAKVILKPWPEEDKDSVL